MRWSQIPLLFVVLAAGCDTTPAQGSQPPSFAPDELVGVGASSACEGAGCVAGDGLTVAVRVTWAQSNPPTDALTVATTSAAEIEQVINSGVIRLSKVQAALQVSAPVEYPVVIDLPDIPVGPVALVALVPDPAEPGVAAIGMALVELDAEGKLTAGGQDLSHVPVIIQGEVEVRP